jgi:hypothetical protein
LAGGGAQAAAPAVAVADLTGVAEGETDGDGDFEGDFVALGDGCPRLTHGLVAASAVPNPAATVAAATATTAKPTTTRLRFRLDAIDATPCVLRELHPLNAQSRPGRCRRSGNSFRDVAPTACSRAPP